MTIKGYSVVNLRDDEGRHTVGFRKIKSALDNWEKRSREVEENVENGLIKLLEDTELSWFDRNIFRHKTKMEKVKYGEPWTLKNKLKRGGYITDDEYKSIDWNLRFIKGVTLYKKLCALIKNGEQFILDDKLCSFVNSYSTFNPRGDK